MRERFADALADASIRTQLMWDRTPMDLGEMVQRAQDFHDSCSRDDGARKTIPKARAVRESREETPEVEPEGVLAARHCGAAGQARPGTPETTQGKPSPSNSQEMDNLKKEVERLRAQLKRGPTSKKETMACWNCGELGHFSAECPKPRKDGKPRRKGQRQPRNNGKKPDPEKEVSDPIQEESTPLNYQSRRTDGDVPR